MYGKIFESMYEGTLYGQWEAIVTMQQLIVLADENGIVDMTPPAIAGKTSIPLDIIEKGLKILAGPDPYSRTPGNDGVRIKLIDDHKPWGWYLVNHEKYTKLQKRIDKRNADRERIAEKRKSLNEQGCRKVSQPVANVAYEDEDKDIDENNKTLVRSSRTTRFDDFWSVYPTRKDKKKAKDIWKRKKLDDIADKIIANVSARVVADKQWLDNFIPLPTTFLRNERWEDEWGDVSAKPTLDGEAAAYGIKRQPNETDESLKRRLGVAMTNARYAR